MLNRLKKLTFLLLFTVLTALSPVRATPAGGDSGTWAFPGASFSFVAGYLDMDARQLHLPAVAVYDNAGNVSFAEAMLEVADDAVSQVRLAEWKPLPNPVASVAAVCCTDNGGLVIPDLEVPAIGGSKRIQTTLAPLDTDHYALTNILRNFDPRDHPDPENYAVYREPAGTLHIPAFKLHASDTSTYELFAEVVPDEPSSFEITNFFQHRNQTDETYAIYERDTAILYTAGLYVQQTDATQSYRATIAFDWDYNPPRLSFIATQALPVSQGLTQVTKLSDTRLQATWAPAQKFARDAETVSYQIHLSQTPDFVPGPDTLQAVTADTEYTFSDLQPGAPYYVSVVAVDELGQLSLERNTAVIEPGWGNLTTAPAEVDPADATPPLVQSVQPVPPANPNPPKPGATHAQAVPPGQIKKILHDEAELEISATALESAQVITVKSLLAMDMPALDPGMTNVTRGPRKGYRFLPHGQKFKDKVTLRIPYDKTLLPPGKSEDDINTYYFDEQAGNWKRVDRTELDMAKGEIVSVTDHFTDFINATVTVPDAPGTANGSPTQFKDMKAISPGEKINLIAPPQANSMGGAQLSYPIEIPAGRQGLQPQLALQYQSDGGNSWTGTGWNLSVPSVGIDTRWGVPRYSPGLETETYLLNGQQLDLLAHRGALQPRAAERQFRPRIEGSFQRILRHGDSPQNYWWEVTDKNGTVYSYGGSAAAGPVAEAVITDYQGNIFQWFLWQVRDTHGNTVQYRYTQVNDTGVIGGSVPGYDVYPTTIHYTGYQSETGPYTVRFIRDRELGEGRRPDVSINNRGAFKRVTADLLRKIEISYENELVRSYELQYKRGAFRKTLLDAVRQYGAAGTLFNTHTFDYYDDIRTGAGAYRGFGAAEDYDTRDDGISVFGQGVSTALGSSRSTMGTGHLFCGLAIGGCTKQFALGGKVGYQQSSSEGLAVFIDINGDGLPDKVFAKNGNVYFRANVKGQPHFGERRVVANLGMLSKSKTRQFSGGAELYLIGNIGFNYGKSYSQTDVYLTEANGDGLPDLVAGGRVLFNYIDANGTPHFTTNSLPTPNPVGQGAIAADTMAEDFSQLREEQMDAFPLMDTVWRWSAPFAGKIQISGDAALIENTGPERQAYQTADGVRVAIQLGQAELWSSRIEADDYTPKTPTDVAAIDINQGDVVYFRVQSIDDGAYDQVDWLPEIHYLDVDPALDANQLDVHRYQAGEDFALAAYRGTAMQMPLAGTVQISGTFNKLAATSDDLRFELFKNDDLLLSQDLTWDQTGSIAIDQELTVTTADQLYARIKIDSPVDLQQLQWQAPLQITYLATEDDSIQLQDEAGNPTVQFTVLPDHDVYSKSDLDAPLQAWEATGAGSLETLFALPPGTDPELNGEFTVTVKRADDIGLVAKGTITVSDGVLENTSFNFAATAGERFFIEVSTRDITGIAAQLSQTQIAIAGQSVPIAVYEAMPAVVAPRDYRGWTALPTMATASARISPSASAKTT